MKKRMKKGFTLVEIMIVVAIIAILAAVAIPNFLKYRADARSQSCVSNMQQLKTAAESWRTTQSNPQAVPAVSDLVGTESSKYIPKESIICPEGGDYTLSTAEGSTAIAVTCPNVGTLTDHVLK